MGGDNHEFRNQDARALIGTVDWDTGLGLSNFSARQRKAVLLDPATHALLVVDYPHHEIHAGEHHVAIAGTLMDTDGVHEILFKSPLVTGHTLDQVRRRKAHLVLSVDSSLASTVRLYRNSTKTFNASNLVPYWNRNDHAFAASESYFTSSFSICVAPGGTENSEDILGPIFLGSNQAGPFGVEVGGSTGTRNEFILEPDRWYRIEVVSRANSNAVNVWFDWYDHAEQTDYTG